MNHGAKPQPYRPTIPANLAGRSRRIRVFLEGPRSRTPSLKLPTFFALNLTDHLRGPTKTSSERGHTTFPSLSKWKGEHSLLDVFCIATNGGFSIIFRNVFVHELSGDSARLVGGGSEFSFLFREVKFKYLEPRDLLCVAKTPHNGKETDFHSGGLW